MLQGFPPNRAATKRRRLAVVLTVVVTVCAGWFVPVTSAEATAPAASRLSPASVRAGGGAKVTVTGRNLSRVKAVYVGATKVTKVTRLSTSKLRFTAPSHAIGTAKISLLVGKKKYATGLILTYLTDTPGANSFEAEVFRLTNNARAKARTCGTTKMGKVAAVKWNAILATAARAHSADMAAKNYFAHSSPDGTSFSTRLTRAGYRWRTVGENIAAGYSTPAAVVAGWLKSTGHCKNIMASGFTELGVGFAPGGSYGTYWTQDFGRPA